MGSCLTDSNKYKQSGQTILYVTKDLKDFGIMYFILSKSPTLKGFLIFAFTNFYFNWSSTNFNPNQDRGFSLTVFSL